MTETKKTPAVRNRRLSFDDQTYRDQADFRSALRRFVRFSEEHARAQGITPQQYLLLLAVRGHPAYPSVSIGTIAESLQIRHHSTSLLVDRSVRRGLLDRREDPQDRRRALVSLTDEGHRLLDLVMEANRRQMLQLRSIMLRDSLKQAIDAYDAMAASASE